LKPRLRLRDKGSNGKLNKSVKDLSMRPNKNVNVLNTKQSKRDKESLGRRSKNKKDSVKNMRLSRSALDRRPKLPNMPKD
jgi:hypothetical protein